MNLRTRSRYLLIIAPLFAAFLMASCGGGGATGPQWGVPELLYEVAGGDLDDLAAVIDEQGNAHVIWGHGYTTWTSHYAVATGWTAAEQLTPGIPMWPRTLPSGRLVVDAMGIATATWVIRDNNSADEIWAKRYTPGSGWGLPELAETLDGDVDDVELAVDANNYLYLAWSQDEDNGDDTVWITRNIPGSGWEPAVRIEPGSQEFQGYPSVAADSGSNAIAIGIEYKGTPRWILWASRFTETTGWGVTELAAADTYTVYTDPPPQVVVDSAGNAIAIWLQAYLGINDNDGFAEPSIYTSYYMAGAGWSQAEVLEDNHPSSSAEDPHLAMNAAGEAFLVWHEGTNGVDGVWARRYVPGSGWSEPAKISGALLRARGPKVAVDVAGKAVVVFHADGHFWANRFAPGGGWGSPQLIDNSPAGAYGQTVAVNAAGTAVAVWVEHDGNGGKRIGTSRLE